jgi:hypothetical protein
VLGAAAILVGALACYGPTDPDDDTLEPTHGNVDLAREVWLGSRPSEYTFQIGFRTTMTPWSGYFSVHVADGVVIAAADSAGRAVEDFSTTVDTVWEWLLRARADGEVHSVRFNYQGVPVEVNAGRWEVDGGWESSVRKFERIR